MSRPSPLQQIRIFEVSSPKLTEPHFLVLCADSTEDLTKNELKHQWERSFPQYKYIKDPRFLLKAHSYTQDPVGTCERLIRKLKIKNGQI